MAIRVASIIGMMIFVSHTVYAQESPGSLDVQLLPSRRVVQDFLADGTAHRFSVSTIVESREAVLSVGGIVPWADISFFGVPLQVSTGASVYARLDPGESIGIISTDFSVDYALIDAEWTSDFIVRGGIGHASHHLGDSFADSVRKPIDYSRDYVSVYLVHGIFASQARVYAGLNYGYNFVASRRLTKPVVVQAGMSGVLLQFADHLSLYGGWDVKMRQELRFGTTQRFEAGVEYTNEWGRSVRLGVGYVAGLDERGQFFGERRNETSLGIRMEF